MPDDAPLSVMKDPRVQRAYDLDALAALKRRVVAYQDSELPLHKKVVQTSREQIAALEKKLGATNAV